MYGTEWPILCWCAVKKLLTHSLTEYIAQYMLRTQQNNSSMHFEQL